MILRPLFYRLYKAPILSLHASIMSGHGPPRLYFEPLKLLNFDINADPDPAIHCNVDPDPAFNSNAEPDSSITLIQIRIQLPKIMRIHCGSGTLDYKIRPTTSIVAFSSGRVLEEDQVLVCRSKVGIRSKPYTEKEVPPPNTYRRSP